MKLAPDVIEQRLSGMPGWRFADDALTRKYTLASFPDAVAFVTRLAFEAEAADHHPDLLVNYKRVTVTWATHSEGGVTEKDFAGAAQSDRIAKAFSGE
jgi:4a-hydroxytetrahydrobiopterin dehydratase